MTRVLVTRPEPGATRTAARLLQLGYEAIKLPLSQIVGLEASVPANKFDAVIATSANAFLYLQKVAVTALTGVPTFVVGEATAQAAKQAGFHHVKVNGGDVDGLLATLKDMLAAGDRVLYLAGKVRRPDIEDMLGARGVVLEVCEVYDTKLVSHSTDKLNFLNDKPAAAVLLTSVTTAEALVQILESSNLSQLHEKSRFICLSNRIADALKRASNGRIHKVSVCDSPDEDAMIAHLVKLLPA